MFLSHIITFLQNYMQSSIIQLNYSYAIIVSSSTKNIPQAGQLEVYNQEYQWEADSQLELHYEEEVDSQH